MKKLFRIFVPIITVIAILGANFAWGAAEVFAADPQGNGKGLTNRLIIVWTLVLKSYIICT
jgi:hypothetical protein